MPSAVNEVDDVVRHLIVASQWDVLHLVVDDDMGDVVLLLEDFTCLGSEGGRFIGAGDGNNGWCGDKRKIVIFCFFRIKI